MSSVTCEHTQARNVKNQHLFLSNSTSTNFAFKFLLPAYKCNFCVRAFAQSNDLVKHLRSHVGTNTYQCAECELAFRLQSELKEHIKIHYVNEQPRVSASSTLNTLIQSVVEISDEQLQEIEKNGRLI